MVNITYGHSSLEVFKLDGDTLRSKVSSNSSGVFKWGAEKISDDIVFGTSLAYILQVMLISKWWSKSELDTYILGTICTKNIY